MQKIGRDPEREEFERWYRQEYPRVLSVMIVSVNNRDVAQEATDEAFTRVLERWPRVSMLDSPAAWTIRVGLNVATRTQQRRRRERDLTERYAITDIARADGYLFELMELVDTLPPRARIAVALRYVLVMSEDEIAQIMGVSTGTVSTMLHRARRSLGELLREQSSGEIGGLR